MENIDNNERAVNKFYAKFDNMLGLDKKKKACRDVNYLFLDQRYDHRLRFIIRLFQKN